MRGREDLSVLLIIIIRTFLLGELLVFAESYLNKIQIIHNMVQVTVNQKMYDLMKKMDNRLQKIEVEVKEIRDEIGLEVRPEYLEKLEKIKKDTVSFDKKEDFLNYLENEI